MAIREHISNIDNGLTISGLALFLSFWDWRPFDG